MWLSDGPLKSVIHCWSHSSWTEWGQRASFSLPAVPACVFCWRSNFAKPWSHVSFTDEGMTLIGMCSHENSWFASLLKYGHLGVLVCIPQLLLCISGRILVSVFSFLRDDLVNGLDAHCWKWIGFLIIIYIWLLPQCLFITPAGKGTGMYLMILRGKFSPRSTWALGNHSSFASMNQQSLLNPRSMKSTTLPIRSIQPKWAPIRREHNWLNTRQTIAVTCVKKTHRNTEGLGRWYALSKGFKNR